MFVIFDLDGTLADIEHRLWHIQPPTSSDRKKDWKAFHSVCVHDEPIVPIQAVFRALYAQRHTIEIWSGRSDKVRAETENWLIDNSLWGYSKLLMRMHGDYRPDHELKELWLNHLIATGIKPDLVFDDRSRLVEMWRRNGIRCCQVAPGEF
jgi:FMN phosphatase YigB (HAD superfamily)